MPTIEGEWGSLPFERAIAFFLRKLNVPTAGWAELWADQHIKAFTVAGAVKADLIMDLREAVERALVDGESLQKFRERFDDIVATHGWTYRGSRKWRSDLILNTNLRTAYAAGRWEQIERVKDRRPYMMYEHGHSKQPRIMHQSWDKLILPVDDPWWNTHYPPNGWGCKCRVRTLSERDMDRKGLTVKEPPNDGTYEWVDPKDENRRKIIPNGIDPGWDYHVGKQGTGWTPDFNAYPDRLGNRLKAEVGSIKPPPAPEVT